VQASEILCKSNDPWYPERYQITPNTALHNPPPLMPSLGRYIRGIRAVGIKEWWHQMQYIGDVKAGTFVGSDQCVCPAPRWMYYRVIYFDCVLTTMTGSRIGSETVTLRISTRNKKCLVQLSAPSTRDFADQFDRPSSLGRFCAGSSRSCIRGARTKP
jgi:hypothetical protein